LQKAKQEFRETAKVGEEKLPYYWAAPILVGKDRPYSSASEDKVGPDCRRAFLACYTGQWLADPKKEVVANRRSNEEDR
jgi:hypothetical protein